MYVQRYGFVARYIVGGVYAHNKRAVEGRTTAARQPRAYYYYKKEIITLLFLIVLIFRKTNSSNRYRFIQAGAIRDIYR